MKLELANVDAEMEIEVDGNTAKVAFKTDHGVTLTATISASDARRIGEALVEIADELDAKDFHRVTYMEPLP
jgi:hypothetical protein